MFVGPSPFKSIFVSALTCMVFQVFMNLCDAILFLMFPFFIIFMLLDVRKTSIKVYDVSFLSLHLHDLLLVGIYITTLGD